MVLKAFCDRIVAAKCSSKSSTETVDNSQVPACSKAGSSDSKFPKASLWSSFFTSGFSVIETYSKSPASEKKAVHSQNSGWAAAVRKVVTAGSMRRFQERVLGSSRTDVSSSDGDIWLLGVCHKFSQQESTGDVDNSIVFAAFEQDFSSKILLTYRKGFDAIGDSKYTSDVNWGCMLRSSQMLVAQALLFHKLGRMWRKTTDKPLDKEYLDILQHFGDSEASSFSIHNLLQAGKGYGLAVGSWVGPYAMCRSWEVLARNQRETNDHGEQPLPMALYVVSGDEDGERGGAPVVCIEDASRRCSEFSRGLAAWTPLLLLVPLVLGLDKVNLRYIPLLQSTFKFPQSLGILGGKPGASTYIIGVQNEKAFYLDPHDVQPVVHINGDAQDPNTSSYHCNIVRQMPLDSIDPSLAIGFYCRDKDDFDDFCSRASKLAEESNGAPLFTVAQSRSFPFQDAGYDVSGDNTGFQEDDSHGVDLLNDAGTNEDDWQLL
ncbi:cysteine protease ATG4 isoform X1 [Lotus japonicus]|uniref:cysteine protease ATG4 isoform X1 n=2 Tax=Lotus japonicus TaxID=34305 RepID=UPI0025892587|nr:cysteine protease ATG4 isoform X1 [Lotus japonicus]